MNNNIHQSRESTIDNLDFKELWRIVRSYRYAEIIIFSIVVFTTTYIAFTTMPTYESITTVMIQQNEGGTGSFVFDIGGAVSGQRLKNEIEILRSYTLHEQVLRSLIANGMAEKSSIFGTRYVRKRYRLKTVLMNWFAKPIGEIVTPSELSESDFIDLVIGFKESSEVRPLSDADILEIAVQSQDSSEAIYLTNALADHYRRWDIIGGRGEIQYVLNFLDSQIVNYERKLTLVENEIESFKKENQIYTLDGSAGLLLQDLTIYEGIYYNNVADMEVASKKIEYLQNQLDENEKALVVEIANTTNPMIVALRTRIADLEAQKIQQMVDEGWGESSLQARDFNRRIDDMKSKLTNLTETLILSGWSEGDPFAASQGIFQRIIEEEVTLHSSQSRANEYRKLVDQMSNRINMLPTQTLQYARLERDRKLNENLFLTMKQKYEETRITEAGQKGKVSIMDPALRSVKVGPRKKAYVLLGCVFGLSLGFGYAFIREYFDNTIKSVEQLERKGLTVLGIIPDLHQGTTKKRPHNPSKGGAEFRKRLITYEDPKSPISESYRSIRTNISFLSANKSVKSVLISSPQPGEGKSTTVANLAIAFAQLRKRTLLIDTDLRKPVQHNVFELPRGPGISDYLSGSIEDFKSIIHQSKVENLFIVTAGTSPPNPSELLGSGLMSELTAQLEKEWDMILFDSPPLIAVTDASMVSPEIDQIILVVKAGQTDRAAVDRALDTLNNVNAPLGGVILNEARPENMSGKYGYYYSYYQYYNYSDEKQNRPPQK